MKTYEPGYEEEKSKQRLSKKEDKHDDSDILRFIETTGHEKISRMMQDSANQFVQPQADATGRAIFRSAFPNAFVQMKLEISQPGDAHEEQADQVANAVMKGDTQQSQFALDENPAPVQTKGEGGALTTTPDFDSQLQTTKGSGSKMDEATKGELEQHTGTDLSGVNIHTGNDAHTMSESINAKAFTHGQDIYFKNGNYNPGTPEGKSLLAHEVAHTVQQGSGVERKVMREPGGKNIDDEIAALKQKMQPDHPNAKTNSELPDVLIFPAESSRTEISETLFGNDSYTDGFDVVPVPFYQAKPTSQAIRVREDYRSSLKVDAVKWMNNIYNTMQADLAQAYDYMDRCGNYYFICGEMMDQFGKLILKWSQMSEYLYKWKNSKEEEMSVSFFDFYIDELMRRKYAQPNFKDMDMNKRTYDTDTLWNWYVKKAGGSELYDAIVNLVHFRSVKYDVDGMGTKNPKPFEGMVVGYVKDPRGNLNEVKLGKQLLKENFLEIAEAKLRSMESEKYRLLFQYYPPEGTAGIEYYGFIFNFHFGLYEEKTYVFSDPMDETWARFYWIRPGIIPLKPYDFLAENKTGNVAIDKLNKGLLDKAIADSKPAQGDAMPILDLDYAPLTQATMVQRYDMLALLAGSKQLTSDKGIMFFTRMMATTPDADFAKFEQSNLFYQLVTIYITKTSSRALIQFGQVYNKKIYGSGLAGTFNTQESVTVKLGQKSGTYYTPQINTKSADSYAVARDKWVPGMSPQIGMEQGAPGNPSQVLPGRLALSFKNRTWGLKWKVWNIWDSEAESRVLHPAEFVTLEMYSDEEAEPVVLQVTALQAAASANYINFWLNVGKYTEAAALILDVIIALRAGVRGFGVLNRFIMKPVFEQGAKAAISRIIPAFTSLVAAVGEEEAVQSVFKEVLFASSSMTVNALRIEANKGNKTVKDFLKIVDISMGVLAARDILHLAAQGHVGNLVRAGFNALASAPDAIAKDLKVWLNDMKAYDYAFKRALREKIITVGADGKWSFRLNGEVDFLKLFKTYREGLSDELSVLRLADQMDSLPEEFAALIREMPSSRNAKMAKLLIHPDYGPQSLAILWERLNEPGIPATLRNEVMQSPELMKVMMDHGSNFVDPVFRRGTDAVSMLDIWDKFTKGRTGGTVTVDFAQYTNLWGGKTGFMRLEATVADMFDMKKFAGLDINRKGLLMLEATEPALARALSDESKELPKHIRDSVKVAMNNMQELKGLQGTDDFATIREKVVNEINKTIGSSIKDVNEFKQVMGKVGGGSTRGSIGEWYAFTKNFLVKRGGSAIHKPSIDVSGIRGFEGRSSINPDQIHLNPNRTVDIKVGYENGDIDIVQLEYYDKLITQSKVKGSAIQNNLKTLGVTDGKLKGHDYLFLPGPDGNAITAAERAYNTIKAKNFSNEIKVFYQDNSGVIKEFVSASRTSF